MSPVRGTAQPAALPPLTLRTGGPALRVTRAWPGKEPGQLAVEARELGDAPRLRAGTFTAGPAQGARVSLLPYGQDPKLKPLEALTQGGTLVSHRPRKRAVVRREQGGTVVFTKVVRPGRAQGILEGISRAAAFADAFRTPQVLGSDESTVTFAELKGTSLHTSDGFSRDQWAQAWTEVLDAWRQAVSAADRTPSSAPVHDAAAESEVLRHWTQSAEPYISDRAQLRAAADHVQARIAQLGRSVLAPSHRDLHDKQLLWSAEHGPGLLDVDTACMADPALDLGNLRAHAELRRRQGIWSAAEAETVRFCVDEAAEAAGVPREAVSAYEAATLLRLGCLYALRPQYAGVAAELREAV